MGWTQTRSQIAIAKRRDPDADTTELRRKLKAERLEEYIRQTVDAAPPLTAEQRGRLASLLRPEFLESQALHARACGGGGQVAS